MSELPGRDEGVDVEGDVGYVDLFVVGAQAEVFADAELEAPAIEGVVVAAGFGGELSAVRHRRRGFVEDVAGLCIGGEVLADGKLGDDRCESTVAGYFHV